MNILVITTDYPDKRRSVFPFVKQLVDEFARQGHHIQVVAPYSLTHNLRLINQEETINNDTGRVKVYRPYYLSFSHWKIGKYCPSVWTIMGAFQRGIKMLDEQPNVVYGHFWSCAYAGYDYAKGQKLPIFVATGESVIGFRANSIKKKAFCDYVSGVICVSSKNKTDSIRLGLTDESKCIVIPNAVNLSLFRIMDQKKCREQLGIPQNIFIVIFVGWFVDRKGAKRVSEAIALIQERDVFSIFIGEGEEKPECVNILYMGKASHERIPEYLNAADVFVLPTLNEGCSNAIIEAMACGLPVVSSNLSFNWDILDKTNSLLINPHNIDEIAEAIKYLHNNPLKRNELSKGALKTAERLGITQRAEMILSFINQRVIS